MTPPEAAEQILKACNAMTVEMMKVLPAARALENKAVQDEIIKAQYQLTKEVETIKKLVRKLKTEQPPEL